MRFPLLDASGTPLGNSATGTPRRPFAVVYTFLWNQEKVTTTASETLAQPIGRHFLRKHTPMLEVLGAISLSAICA